MEIKDPNSLFKNDGNRSHYIYVYFDGPGLEALEDWLDEYKGTLINSLEVQPYIYKDKDRTGEYKEYMASKVILDVFIPNKYFNDGVSAPADYI